MKKCLVFGLSLALVSVLTASAVAAAAHSYLVGTWSGIGKGLSSETGFYDIPLTMNIMEVQGDLFRGTLTAMPPGGTIATIPFSGVILMPEKELYISLGYNAAEDGPMFTWIRGRLAGRICWAFWQNIASGDCGTIRLKKSLAD